MIVKVTDKKTVYGTGKSKHLKKGVEKKVSSVLADKLVKAGKASYDKPKGK